MTTTDTTMSCYQKSETRSPLPIQMVTLKTANKDLQTKDQLIEKW
jgi:hypothetical protein